LADHIIIIEDERLAEKVPNGKFHKTGLVGKPRTRWGNVMRRHTPQILGIREWRKRAEDREEWRRVLRGARSQKGL
jgi:hypothetical protein